MATKPQHHDGHHTRTTAAGCAGKPPSAEQTTAKADTSDGTDSSDASAATENGTHEEDLRGHAEMLACLVEEHRSGGLVALHGRLADPQGSGQEHTSATQIEETGIVNGTKHIQVGSRGVPNQIMNAAEDVLDSGPHHLYAPLAIMDDALPAGQPGRESDIVGVLGLVACLEGVSDVDERLPLEPDYILACA